MLRPSICAKQRVSNTAAPPTSDCASGRIVTSPAFNTTLGTGKPSHGIAVLCNDNLLNHAFVTALELGS